MSADTFPRLPTDKEKEDIAAIVFQKPASKVNFTDVWLLAPLYNSLEYNCMGWSILVSQSISIPDKLDTFNYLAAHAVDRYGAPYDYTPTTYGAADAAIRVWGSDPEDVMHASRLCTKELLKRYEYDFQLKLDFDAPAAQGFPDVVWSSKYGDRQAFTTHPRDWLEGSVWGKGLEDLGMEKDNSPNN